MHQQHVRFAKGSTTHCAAAGAAAKRRSCSTVTVPGIPRGDTEPLLHNTTTGKPCNDKHQHKTLLQGQLIRPQVNGGAASHPATTIHPLSVSTRLSANTHLSAQQACTAHAVPPHSRRGLQRRLAPCLGLHSRPRHFYTSQQMPQRNKHLLQRNNYGSQPLLYAVRSGAQPDTVPST